MTVGQRIKEARERKGMTQGMLADALSPLVKTRQAVSSYEKDTAIPSAPVMVKISQLLDIGIEELYGGAPTRIGPAVSDHGLQSKYVQSLEDQIELLKSALAEEKKARQLDAATIKLQSQRIEQLTQKELKLKRHG